MQSTELLKLILFCVCILIFILIFIYIMIKITEKNNKDIKENTNKENKENKVNKKEKSNGNIPYGKGSVFNFMEFSKIEDNMIIQEDLKKYLMVVECEGINYDLMSEIEKTSVEMGFVQFLNTLRFPIQLYIQTRTVNISESVSNYKEKINETYKKISQKQNEYNILINEPNYDPKELDKIKREIDRLVNLYEYGEDIIKNIEVMSLNKNVLKKNYYIVVSYYESELGNNLLQEGEKKNLIFSELYTRAESLIKILYSCSVKGKVLNSYELADLLYVAYNRDDSDIYSVKKAIQAGYEDMYSTGEDVIEKRAKTLDKKIHEEAQNLAMKAIDDVRENEIREKEKRYDDLVNEIAEEILREHEMTIGTEVTEKAIKSIKSKNKKEKGAKKE